MKVVDDSNLPRRIPWRDFMDGRTYAVDTVSEYQKTPRQFRQALSVWAHRHGRTSTSQVSGNTVTFRMELIKKEES